MGAWRAGSNRVVLTPSGTTLSLLAATPLDANTCGRACMQRDMTKRLLVQADVTG